MPKLHINDRAVEVPEGATVLDAARRLGIEIPTLCHLDGLAPFTSCMVCVVRDRRAHRLLSSCTHPAQDGMDLETEVEEVRRARRATLALLLSEHVGDCEAPCRPVCPARMHIPQMIRQIREGRTDEALITAKTDLVLPAVLGRVCPAPCEKGCRRAAHDEAVAIASLHGHAAERDLAAAAPWRPDFPPLTGRRVAIVGAGPAGLAAAWHLRRFGVACTVFDRAEAAGGLLRTAIPEEKLPRDLLDRELASLALPDVEFRFGAAVGDGAALQQLRASFDAVVFAPGTLEAAQLEAFGLPRSARGLACDQHTLATPVDGVFAAGAVIHGTRMAVRAVADGHLAARSILDRFEGRPPAGRPRRFNSRIGKLVEGDLAAFLAEAEGIARVAPTGAPRVFDGSAAHAEAGRCFGCDCRKAASCKLRLYADEYDADAETFRAESRLPVRKLLDHPDLLFEAGKCIRCGLCVRITAKAGEPLGMTFLGRGYEGRVGPSFDEGVARALGASAAACVEACPTAALAWRKWEERRDDG
jgi:ferredoxin